MKSTMFLLCVYAICTEMHKEEKMAALKCKEQQRDKKCAKHGDPRSSGKTEHKTAVWNFFCGAHALKCIAMEGSFLLCNVREHTHSRVSTIHSNKKNVMFFFICNAACKEMHKEKQGQQIFNAHGWMIMCGSRKMKGTAQQCIVKKNEWRLRLCEARV